MSTPRRGFPARPLRVSRLVFAPFISGLTFISNRILRLLGVVEAVAEDRQAQPAHVQPQLVGAPGARGEPVARPAVGVF